MDKQIVTQAFEALGVARVEAGIAGGVCQRVSPWVGCFLARCYGAPGELDAIIKWGECDPFRSTATLLGLTYVQVEEVICAFDNEHSEFMALAREWLEAHPSRVMRARRALSGVHTPEQERVGA